LIIGVVDQGISNELPVNNEISLGLIMHGPGISYAFAEECGV